MQRAGSVTVIILIAYLSLLSPFPCSILQNPVGGTSGDNPLQQVKVLFENSE
jgi:hypothetical protein